MLGHKRARLIFFNLPFERHNALFFGPVGSFNFCEASFKDLNGARFCGAGLSFEHGLLATEMFELTGEPLRVGPAWFELVGLD